MASNPMEQTAATGDGLVSFEEAALLEGCRRGDAAAWTALVERCQDRVFNLCRRMSGNAEDAADLTQEAFVKAIESLGSFGGRSSLYTWIFRIAVNLSISHRRKQGRRRTLSLSGGQPGDPDGRAAATVEPPAADDAGPQSQASGRERDAAVAAALDELDDEHRVVLVLRDIESMEYAEVAAVLDVPVGTIKSRLFRARMALRQRLGQGFLGA